MGRAQPSTGRQPVLRLAQLPLGWRGRRGQQRVGRLLDLDQPLGARLRRRAHGNEPRDDEQGGHDVLSRAEFDDVNRAVTISLDRGEITALKGRMAGRLDVYILRELREEAPKEGEAEKDPVPTPENTLWHGSVVLHNATRKASAASRSQT